ncbi:MAG TPA: YaiI/YqxD family protein [Phenylobacterium sp.]
MSPRIFVDADACPVKDEAYKVARRYGLQVYVVAGSFLMVPKEPRIERVIVEAGPDAADDWIAEHVEKGDVVVTHDLPLAERCLNAGAEAIGPTGRVFTRDSIGQALAGRAIGEHLRSIGEVTRGPPPFQASDRSRFLSALDDAVHRARRAVR